MIHEGYLFFRRLVDERNDLPKKYHGYLRNSSLGLRKEGRRVMLQFDHSLFGTRPSLLSLYVLLKVIDTCLLVDRSDCKRKVEDPALLK